MHIGLHVGQEKQLRLNLTPALKHSIDILQMHTLDLTSYLQELAWTNPLIDIEPGPQPTPGRPNRSVAKTERLDPLATLQAKNQSLEQMLTHQLRLLNQPPHIVKAAAFLAGNLNDDGYLEIELGHASSLCGCSQEVMELGLELLHQMDPPGVGARNLQECLSIQMRQDPSAPALALPIVNRFFIELAHGKIDSIAKKLGATVECVKQAISYIRRLNPRPGLAFGHHVGFPLIPDGEIVRAGNRYAVRMFDHYLPRITINRDYAALAESHVSKDTAEYLKDKLHQAKWIMRSLGQRKLTLHRVMTAIVDRQQEFIRHGEQELRPMTLRELAAELHLHESTISRAVQNKSIQTCNGIIPLKSFFSNGFSIKDGQLTSQTSIKSKIKQLIDAEAKTKPISDSQIAEYLKKEGIQISRRTVTKYREEMGILSSMLRKSL